MEHVNQLRRMGLFDAKVPRYTSYPPATKFSNDVSGPVLLDWIDAIPTGSKISLYLHVAVLPQVVLVLCLSHPGRAVRRTGTRLRGHPHEEVRAMGARMPAGVDCGAPSLGWRHADAFVARPDDRVVGPR